jgi:hypothetical protein
MAALFDEILFDFNLIRKKAGEQYPVSAQLEYANAQPKNAQTAMRKTNIGRLDPVELLTLDIALLTEADRTYFINHLRGGQGSGVGFRCFLPHDHTATLEAFGLGTGALKEFKLVLTYARRGETTHPDVRRIFKPVVQLSKEKNGFQLYEPDGVTPRVITSPLRIFSDGNEVATGWTVDARTGIVYFTTAPALNKVLTWSGHFDVPVAFEGNVFTQMYDLTSGAQYTLREMLGPELGLT